MNLTRTNQDARETSKPDKLFLAGNMKDNKILKSVQIRCDIRVREIGLNILMKIRWHVIMLLKFQ